MIKNPQAAAVAPYVPDQGSSRYSNDLCEWRRISLEKQLPERRFAGSIAVPSMVVLIALLVLAVVCAVYLGQTAGAAAPRAVVISQQDLVSTIARGLNSRAGRDFDQVRAAADQYAADSARDVNKLLQALVVEGSETGVRGVAVLDAGTRQPVASRGEAVPLEALPAESAGMNRVPTVADNDPRILAVLPLADGRILAFAIGLPIRALKLNAEAGQAVLIAGPGGTTALAQGAELPPGDPARQLVQEVVGVASAKGVASRSGPVQESVEGSRPPAVPLAAAAVVGDLGLTVVSVVRAPVIDGGPWWQGLPPAAVLLVAGGLALLIVRRGFVRPVRRLLDDAKAAACGDTQLSRRPSRIAELKRIARALSAPPGGGRKHHPRGAWGGGGFGLTTVLLAAALVVGGAGAGVAAAFAGSAAELPAQIAYDSENELASLASAVNDSLTTGLAELGVFASRHRGDSSGRLGRALAGYLADDERYRSLYIVDAAGIPEVRQGGQPLRPTEQVPGERGILLHRSTGRIPIIYAYVSFDEGRKLVGEFDVRHLSGMLHRLDGRLRVVDIDLRTVIDTEGYLAFQPLAEPVLRSEATTALARGGSAQVKTVARTEMLVATSPLAVQGPAAHLEWSIVLNRPVRDFRLQANDRWRGALAVGFVIIALALLLLGWHYFFLIRPLRQLAAAADRLGGGDTREPVSPHRHDEIGAIAVCMEICRQALVHGDDRLGGTVRLRGVGGPETVVMPRVGADGKPTRAVSRRR